MQLNQVRKANRHLKIHYAVGVDDVEEWWEGVAEKGVNEEGGEVGRRGGVGELA